MDHPHRLQAAIDELRAADSVLEPSEDTCAAVMAAWEARHETSVRGQPLGSDTAWRRRTVRWRNTGLVSAAAASLVVAVGATWWASRVATTTDSRAVAAPARVTDADPGGAGPDSVPRAAVAEPSEVVRAAPSAESLASPEASAKLPALTARRPESPARVQRTAAAVEASGRSGALPPIELPLEGAPEDVDEAFIELAPTTAEDWGAARVLRVNVPEHAIRRLLLEPPAFTAGGMVQADLVVGEDGFARAIRLVHEPVR